MEKITLTEAQKAQIIERLASYHDSTDTFDFEIEFADDDLLVNVKGFVETHEYCEDDYTCGYGNGTGAWVEDYRNAGVELTGQKYDPATDEYVDVEIDDDGDAENYLNAA